MRRREETKRFTSSPSIEQDKCRIVTRPISQGESKQEGTSRTKDRCPAEELVEITNLLFGKKKEPPRTNEGEHKVPSELS
jgi:hypothetical protein